MKQYQWIKAQRAARELNEYLEAKQRSQAALWELWEVLCTKWIKERI